MAEIVILDQKLIFPNDYQKFWVHFGWFLLLFKILIRKMSYKTFKQFHKTKIDNC